MKLYPSTKVISFGICLVNLFQLLFFHICDGLTLSDESLRINLKTGRVLGFSEYIFFQNIVQRNSFWNQSSLYKAKQEPKGCSLQAVLRIDLSGPFTAVKFQLVYNRPKLWTFHLAQNENALGFGSLSTRPDASAGAELQIYNRQLRIYGSGFKNEIDNANSDLIKIVDDAVPRKVRSTVHLDVDNYGLKWDVKEDVKLNAKIVNIHGQGSWYLQSELLFAFQSSNVSSLYIGLNRAVGNGAKHGNGLCSVGISLQKQREKRDECQAVNHTCDKNAFCRGTKNSFRCICKPGYKGNGLVCKDDNECDYKNGNCVQLCTNSEGSYSCSCFRGFQLAPNGHDCLDVDECRLRNGRCLHGCVNTIGSYRCSCRSGHLLASDGFKCLEASLSEPCKNLGCAHGCSAFNGGRCFCKAGFKLHPNTKDCVPTCSVGNGGCQHRCLETPYGSSCACHADYFLAPDSKTCIATCAVENGGCERVCQDTERGAKCICSHGYRLQHDNKTCIDIDECQSRNGRCQYKCLNTLGGFECVCPPGFVLGGDQRSCQDVNECQYNHTCDHTCVNTPGSFLCTCAKGYQLHGFRYCGDIDECSYANGGCQGKCINTNGSYYCSCEKGMVLHQNGKDCSAELSCNKLENNPIVSFVKWPKATMKCEDVDGRCVLDCQDVGSLYLKPDIRYLLSVPPTDRMCSNATNTVSIEISLLTDRCDLANSFGFVSKDSAFLCDDSIHICSVEIKCDRNEIIQKYSSSVFHFKAVALLSAEFDHHPEPYRRSVFKHLLSKRLRKAIEKSGLIVKHYDKEYLIKISSTWKCPDSAKCECKSGTYLNLTYGLCLPCPVGFYQSHENAIDCIPCPSSFSYDVGITSLESCQGTCESGSYSSSGFQPCDQCPLGTYQSDIGRASCVECGSGISTAVQGSQSFQDCIVNEYCREGYFYNQQTWRCHICPIGTYQPKAGQNFCISCPKNMITDRSGSVSDSQCKSSICTKISTNTSGFIESPNYPNDYPSNTICTWDIRASSNRRILIFIPDLLLASDNCKDFLIMRKNASPYSTVSFEACESQSKPVAFTARSRRLWIQFRSDDKNNAKGFRMQYTTYHEQYHPLIEDIVRDSRLYTLPNHRQILQNHQFLEAFMDVVSDPNNYRKYMNVSVSVFPKSFLEILWPKLHRFFDLGDLK